jgi:hypothetical protein
MDKIKKYQSIIIAYFEELKSWQFSNDDCVFITDEKHHHYQIMTYGWDKNDTKYNATIQIHYQIKPNGKVWIIENRTEEDVAEALTQRGVEKSDIVLSFIPERVRQHTGYAMA